MDISNAAIDPTKQTHSLFNPRIQSINTVIVLITAERWLTNGLVVCCLRNTYMYKVIWVSVKWECVRLCVRKVRKTDKAFQRTRCNLRSRLLQLSREGLTWGWCEPIIFRRKVYGNWASKPCHVCLTSMNPTTSTRLIDKNKDFMTSNWRQECVTMEYVILTRTL